MDIFSLRLANYFRFIYYQLLIIDQNIKNKIIIFFIL